MFQTLSSPKKRRANSIIASLLLHVIALTLCLYRAPIFVKPSSLAWGQHGRSETLVYTAQAQLENQQVPKKRLLLPKAKPKPLPEIAKAPVEPPRATPGYPGFIAHPTAVIVPVSSDPEPPTPAAPACGAPLNGQRTAASVPPRPTWMHGAWPPTVATAARGARQRLGTP